MILITCPACEFEFPVAPIASDGWCRCGMDFVIDPAAGVVRWTPDPEHGATHEAVTVPLR